MCKMQHSHVAYGMHGLLMIQVELVPTRRTLFPLQGEYMAHSPTTMSLVAAAVPAIGRSAAAASGATGGSTR